MADKDTWWEMRTNDEGRTVYAYRVKTYSFAVGGVVDYRPGEPPYKIVMVLPQGVAEWSSSLEDAKSRVMNHFFSWLLSK